MSSQGSRPEAYDEHKESVEKIKCKLASSVNSFYCLMVILLVTIASGDSQDEEEQCIRELVKSAILDPKVKGGLRWPLGKESSGDRFSVVGCWHTKYKAFKNSSTRLKLRNADRFDFMNSTGEDAREVTLKLEELAMYLLVSSAFCSLEKVVANCSERFCIVLV